MSIASWAQNKSGEENMSKTNLTKKDYLGSEEHEEEGRVLLQVVYVIIFILGMLGNTAMIFLLKRKRQRRSPSNLLLLHVVISEMSVLLMNIPFDMVLIIVNQEWVFGGLMCKVLWPLQTLTLGSFVWILTLLSYHRYRGIVFPLMKKLSTNAVSYLIMIVWFSSLVVVVPYSSFLEYQNGECIETWDIAVRKSYTLIFFAFQYAFPLLITIYCYAKIAVVVRRGQHRVKRHISGSSQAGLRHKSRGLSAIRTAVLFMATFAVCMLPHQVIWLWLEFGEHTHSVKNLLSFAYIFTFTSSFMNPLVYIFSTPSVRKEFKRKARAFKRGSSGNSSERRILKKYSLPSSGISTMM
ncbi:galanin receptor type 1-like [Actinia tenebrosa]|uniref:Galanin receptor type 1-like n=1 Tax=Actinia tenebrosa TaxID=6105 RepID=A0A6P8HYK1_ACTTE|nr:galanin receptor type 1-like [Actinia tenebrosa]